MKRWIRDNISIVIVVGILLLFGAFYLNQYIHEPGHYSYSNEEAEEALKNSKYGIKTPNYGSYKLQFFDQNRLKHNKKDYGIIYLGYVDGDRYFTYRSGKVKEGYEDRFPITYRISNRETTKEIPYEKIQLKNTTLYYIDSKKYEVFKEGVQFDNNIYFWIIDDISYGVDEFMYNIEHEEVINLVESME